MPGGASDGVGAKLGVGSNGERVEDGGRKVEIGPRTEIGGQKPEAKGRKSEAEGKRSGIGSFGRCRAKHEMDAKVWTFTPCCSSRDDLDLDRRARVAQRCHLWSDWRVYGRMQTVSKVRTYTGFRITASGGADPGAGVWWQTPRSTALNGLAHPGDLSFAMPLRTHTGYASS